MNKAFVIFLHLGYWFLYLLLMAIMYATVSLQLGKTRLMPNLISVFPVLLLFIIPNIISFYSFYFFLFTKFLSRQRIFALVVFGILVCLIAAFVGNLVSIVLFGIDQPIFTDSREFLGFTASQFFLTAIHSGIALVIRGFVTWFDEIKLNEELAKKNYETEMALLKSQINPHFLFNTINNIDVLIAKDSNKASEYLNKLSGILRYMVYETKSEKIALKTELDYIEKYLELQKLRTTNQNYVNLTIEGEPNNLQIAPMIFFPFIENAFKHTENDKKSNSIKINISIKENSVKFECKNTYQKNPQQKQDYGGLGNELIQKRLDLLYHEKHTLEINDSEAVYKVKLTVYEN